MKARVSFFISVSLALCALLGLIICPTAAAGGAKSGLLLCSGVIIPSLFPFAVLSNVLMGLGLPQRLGKVFAPVTKRLFGVSGTGSTAFFLGIAGGYPLGAISVSELYAKGALQKKEAERLLGFCNNCGPAFIISVAGSAVFGSVKIGFFLYLIHVISAFLTGVLISGRHAESPAPALHTKSAGLSEAFTDSVKRAAAAMVTVCGFVVFFSVLVGLLDEAGTLSSLSGAISVYLKTELHFSRSLLTGFLELGTGTSSLIGLSVNAVNLSLCSLIIGWGGISVHAQAAAVIRESGLNPARHTFGKLLHGVLSALITYFTYSLFF